MRYYRHKGTAVDLVEKVTTAPDLVKRLQVLEAQLSRHRYAVKQEEITIKKIYKQQHLLKAKFDDLYAKMPEGALKVRCLKQFKDFWGLDTSLNVSLSVDTHRDGTA
jgi:hypothetical protein